MKLTRSALNALPPPGNQRRFFRDDIVAGLAAVQHPTGAISFELRVRIGGRDGKQITRKLGDHPSMTPEQARTLAQQVKAHATLGVDVIAENHAKIAEEKAAKAAVVTMAMAVAEFQRRVWPRKKAGSIYEDRRKIDKIIVPKLGDRDVRDITRAEIDDLHKAMSDRPYEANRTLALLSSIFSLAVLDGRRPDNPVKGIAKFKEKRIERYLTDAEAEKLSGALEAVEPEHRETVAAIRLLIATGARRGEVLAMRWADLDIDGPKPLWRLPDSKTGGRTVPLNSAAVAILVGLRDPATAAGDVFSLSLDGRITAIKRVWKIVMKSCAFDDRTRIHDLRHSFASILASRGVPLVVAQRAMGHASVQTTQRYAHVFDEALREGIEKAVR